MSHLTKILNLIFILTGHNPFLVRKPLDRLNENVELIGTARDAKAGAVILLPDNTAVYILGLESWDEGVIMKKVMARGILRQHKLAPDPITNENGEVSAGMPGSALCLEDASWKEL